MNESIFEINNVECYKDIIIVCESIFLKDSIEDIRSFALGKYKYHRNTAYGKVSLGFLNKEIKKLCDSLFKIKFNKSCFNFESTFLWKDIFHREFIHRDGNGIDQYALVNGLNINNFEKTYTDFYQFVENFENESEKTKSKSENTYLKAYCQRKIGRIRQTFNKTYFYDSSIFHSPSNGYGINENNSRLGYNIFFEAK